MTQIKNFMEMGGKVTRQVGQYIFGVDGGMGNYEVLSFSANTGELLKAKNIPNSKMADINNVDDLYDFMYGTPTAPDFSRVVK